MFICWKCKTLKEEMSKIKEPRPYGEGVIYEELTSYDCTCGGEYDEAKECRVCGEWQHVDDINEHERECFKSELMTEAYLVGYVTKDKEMQEDFFIEWVHEISSHNSYSLLDILKDEFLERLKDDVKKEHALYLLKEFAVDQDEYYFEWVLEKRKEVE